MKPSKPQRAILAALKKDGSFLTMRDGEWEMNGAKLNQRTCMALFERGHIMADGVDADGRWTYVATDKGREKV